MIKYWVAHYLFIDGVNLPIRLLLMVNVDQFIRIKRWVTIMSSFQNLGMGIPVNIQLCRIIPEIVYTFVLLDENNNKTAAYRYTSSYSNEIMPDGTTKRIRTLQILNDDNTNAETKYRYWLESESYEANTWHILDENNNEIKTLKAPFGFSGNERDFFIALNNLMPTPYKVLGAKINIDGDPTGTVYLNNNIEAVADDGKRAPVNVSLSNTQLHLGLRDNVLDANNLPLNSGTFNMINGTAGISALNTLTINGETNFIADVDLANKEMDRFTATTYGNHSGNLNVIGMNLLSNATDGSDVTAI